MEQNHIGQAEQLFLSSVIPAAEKRQATWSRVNCIGCCVLHREHSSLAQQPTREDDSADGQNGSRSATTPNGPTGMGTAEKLPKGCKQGRRHASRTVRFTRSKNAVFKRAEKPNPRPRAFESCLCLQPHHRRDAHQHAPPFPVPCPGATRCRTALLC
jgi:hypothetical protein